MNMKIVAANCGKILIFCFLFSIKPNTSLCQVKNNTPNPHGTLIFGMICTDGIIIASDSRAMYIDSINGKETVIAYFDNSKKIFDLGDFKMAKAGTSQVGYYQQGYILNGFNKSKYLHRSIDSIFYDYIQFCSDNLCVYKGNILSQHQYIIAGYQNKIPYLIKYMSSQTETQNNISAFTTNHYGILKYISLPAKDSLTCDIAAASIENAIIKISAEDFELGIGGPVEIIKITSDNKSKKLFSFKPVKEYNSGWGFNKSIIDGKVKIRYLSDKYKDTLINKLKKTLQSIPTSEVK